MADRRLLQARPSPWTLATLAILLLVTRPGSGGELELSVVDKDSGDRVAARLQLTGAGRKLPRIAGAIVTGKQIVFDGSIVLKLPNGHYRFLLERGPEYKITRGNFEIKQGATDNKQLVIERYVDMKQEGWWSGDLHIERSLSDIPQLMLAEDLHMSAPITWGNKSTLSSAQRKTEVTQVGHQRVFSRTGGKDDRQQHGVLFFGFDQPLDVSDRSEASFALIGRIGHDNRTHVDLSLPFSPSVPVWVADQNVGSIGLLNHHLLYDGVIDKELNGRARDRIFFPAPHGNGRWSQHIYYQLLNCGLRIPPSAGSGSGRCHNPVGYNRVYVHCGDDFSYDSWWAGLRAGQVVVTNGPLLRPLINGQLPGHVFQLSAGEHVDLDVALKLSTREKIDYLELVQNGRAVQTVRLADWAAKSGKLPPVRFERSGWLVVRAVTNNETTYRYASSGPYYVQIGDQRRISKESAKFFLDWVYDLARDQRKKAARAGKTARDDFVMARLRVARDYWQATVDSANAP